MFSSLGNRLGDIFDRLRKRGALTEADVETALREVRVALLEADVALPVVKDFITHVKERAIGQEVLKSITPGQMVVKIVYDQMVATLGGEGAEINLLATPPVTMMIVGLQGSGKTTSTAKVARLLSTKKRKKVLMASVDVYRPAAREQLKILGQEAHVDTLPIIDHEKPLEIVKRGYEKARLEGYDVFMVDTAGRLHIDDALMEELVQLRIGELLHLHGNRAGQDAGSSGGAAQCGHDQQCREVLFHIERIKEFPKDGRFGWHFGG